MIVVGIDPHMKTHTAVAVDSVTGEVLATRSGEAAFAMHIGMAPFRSPRANRAATGSIAAATAN